MVPYLLKRHKRVCLSSVLAVGLCGGLLSVSALPGQTPSKGASGRSLLAGVPPEGPAEITESIRLAVAERTPARKYKEALKGLQAVLDHPKATASQKSLAWFGIGEAYEEQEAMPPAADAYRNAAEQKDAPPDLRITALLQLGILQLGQGRVTEGLEAVTKATGIEGADRDLHAAAGLARGRLLEKTGLSGEALKEYDAVFNETAAGADTRMEAIDKRYALRRSLGKSGEELDALTKSLEVPGMEDKWRAYLLLRRSMLFLEMDKTTEAVEDAAEVVNSRQELPAIVRAKAYTALGRARLKSGDADSALGLAAKAMAVRESLTDEICDALLLRAQAYHKQQRTDAAIEELTKAADYPGASPLAAGGALMTRAQYRVESGLVSDGILDFSRAVDLPGLPANLLAPALGMRGILYQKRGMFEKMRQDFERVLEMTEATPDQKGRAVLGWAAGEAAAGNKRVAVKLLDKRLITANLPADMEETVWLLRSQLHDSSEGPEAELADYAEILKLPGASVNAKTQALAQRMRIFEALKREEELLQCVNDLVELPGVNPEIQVAMLKRRAVWYEAHQQAEKAVADLKRAEAIPVKSE